MKKKILLFILLGLTPYSISSILASKNNNKHLLIERVKIHKSLRNNKERKIDFFNINQGEFLGVIYLADKACNIEISIKNIITGETVLDTILFFSNKGTQTMNIPNLSSGEYLVTSVLIEAKEIYYRELYVP